MSEQKTFTARYSSPCKVCGGDVKGRASTWVRTRDELKKGYVHIECWVTRAATPTVNAPPMLNTPPAPSTNALATNADSAVLDLLGRALWDRIENRVKAIESNNNELASEVECQLEAFKAELSESIKAATVKVEVDITQNDTTRTIDAGLQHHQFPTLLKMMTARDFRGNRLNVWLSGPAGTGKSTAVEKAAEVLGLRFASIGSLTDSIELFGYLSPHDGKYITGSLFRDIYENGGCFLLDDFDASDPNAVIKTNQALANGVCSFPDGMVKRHSDCVVVLAANTWGYGSTNDYVGRMKQDAAFIDRFPARLFWDTDEGLELATCPNTKWVKHVQKIRAAVKAKGIKVLITPRASYGGSAMLAAGLSWNEVEQSTLKSVMTADQWGSICS